MEHTAFLSTSIKLSEHVCAKVLQSCPYRLEPAKLLLPWDSPGKNTGVGCRVLHQGNLPDPGIRPASLMSPALAGRFFTTSATWEARIGPKSQQKLSPAQDWLSCVKCPPWFHQQWSGVMWPLGGADSLGGVADSPAIPAKK